MKIYALIFLMAGGLIAACSGDSTATPATSSLNDTATAVAAVKSQVAKAQVFAAVSSSSFLERAANTNWTNTALITDLGGENCGTTNSPEKYLEAMTSSTCTVSPFFDLNNLIDMMCVLTNSLETTNGLPNVMSGDVTISIASASACGVTLTSALTTTVEVSATTDTTYYQRRVSFSLNGVRNIYIGASGADTFVAFNYTEGSTSAYRGYYTSNSTTKVSKFALHSASKQGTANGTIFRLLIDESETPGEVFAVGTRNATSSKMVYWSYRAPTDASDSFGVSVYYENEAGGTGSVDTCIDPRNSFVSDGTSSTSCGDGFSAPAIAGGGNFGAVADAAIGNLEAINLNTFFSETGETDVITFDSNSIHSTSMIQ